MAQYTGISLSGSTPQELTDAIIALNRALEFQMANLDSDNVREIGGWRVGQTELSSKTLDVGISTGSVGTDPIRFWAGSTDPAAAPFRVYQSGKLVTTNIVMSGGAISWGSVNPPTADAVGAKPYDWLPSYGDITGFKPPSNADNTTDSIGPQRLTYIDAYGIYTGILTAQQINVIQGITLGANASILWAQLPSLPTAGQVGAKPASYVPSYAELTGGKPPTDADNTFNQLLGNANIKGFVNQGGLLYLNADYIKSGYIKGNQIDVTTDLFVGNRIQVGSNTDLSLKQILFNGTANITNSGYNLSLSSSTLDFLCANINFGNASITGANFVAKFG